MPNRRPSLMGLSMTPWEHHPALTRDRLITIAQLIQRGRNMALDRFDPNVGCTGWTLGCEAFAFQRHQIIEAAADKIGRASCRERVCQYVSISVVALSLKKKKQQLQYILN